MPRLPDDIILTIIAHLDVDTFLDFRLTCRAYYGLINSHINGLADSVAHASFLSPLRGHAIGCSTIPAHQGNSHALTPGSERKVSEQVMTVSARLQWLRWHRHYELASILVEQRPNFSIAAQDPLGDDFRNFVAKGWHALACLAKVLKQVQLEATSDANVCQFQTHDEPTRSQDDLREISQSQELHLCYHWLREMETWPFEQVKAFKWLSRNLSRIVFGFHDPRIWSSELPELAGARCFDRWIASHGPDVFWQCWRRGQVHMLKEKIESDWRHRDPAAEEWVSETQRTLQRQIDLIFRYVKYAVLRTRSKAFLGKLMSSGRRWNGVTELSTPDTAAPFRQREQLTAAGEPIPERCFDDVSFDQKLDWDMFGNDLGAEEARAEQWRQERLATRDRRRRHGCSCALTSRGPRPQLTPPFESLLKEWEEQYLEKIAALIPVRSWPKAQNAPGTASQPS